MLVDVMMWILGIVLKTAAVVGIWIGIKHLVKNGGGVLTDILTTLTTAIRYGCLKLRLSLTGKLREHAEEEEAIKEDPNQPEVKVEGTVV